VQVVAVDHRPAAHHEVEWRLRPVHRLVPGRAQDSTSASARSVRATSRTLRFGIRSIATFFVLARAGPPPLRSGSTGPRANGTIAPVSICSPG
jgi:hypothetical protein